MSMSEMLCIMVLFHLSSCKNFKHYYERYIPMAHSNEFPVRVSYSRFIQLMPRLMLPMCLSLHLLSGKKTGTYYVDSTSVKVCHNLRIGRHKVFKGMTARGKTTTGWFFGFKLHLVINACGEIMAMRLTPGNVDDRAPILSMTQGLKGDLFADKGYISNRLFQSLMKKGLRIVTGIRKNMKNYLMRWKDKMHLRKRYIIETIFDILKNTMSLEHTRHRSPTNAIINIIAALIAYQTQPNKPKITPTGCA